MQPNTPDAITSYSPLVPTPHHSRPVIMWITHKTRDNTSTADTCPIHAGRAQQTHSNPVASSSLPRAGLQVVALELGVLARLAGKPSPRHGSANQTVILVRNSIIGQRVLL
eukprot:766973-Hanusia_phi.AAC.2